MWVLIFDKKGIKITAVAMKWQVDAYHTAHCELSNHNMTHQKYSKEAFIDAIVEWIVTDNQVS